jgi:hypothetical protein
MYTCLFWRRALIKSVRNRDSSKLKSQIRRIVGARQRALSNLGDVQATSSGYLGLPTSASDSVIAALMKS